MTSSANATPVPLDFSQVARWPQRAAAHVLGAGLTLAVLVALPLAPTDLDRHQLPKESIVHLATWLALMLAQPLQLNGLRRAARWSLAFFLILVVASAAIASNGWLALRAGSLIITGAAAFITARHLAANGAGAILLSWCGIAGVVGAGTGLSQAYGAHSVFFALTRVPGGTFGNRNFMAHFAGLTLPVLILGALSSRRHRFAVLMSVGCAVLVAAIVLSRSRAAWIGSTAGVALFLGICLLARRRHALPVLRNRVMILGAVMVLGIAAAMLIPNRLAWRSASPYLDTVAALANRDEGSGHGRLLQYQNTIHLARQNALLGVGPGNWPIHYGEVAPASDPTWVFGDVIPINPWPSSDWMALISEIGVPATVLALLFGLSLAWRGVHASRSSGDQVLGGAALLALLTTLFIEGNFDVVLMLPASLLFSAMAAGALLQRADGDQATKSGAQPAWRIAALVPVLLAAITLRSLSQTAAYAVAGNGKSLPRLSWAARVDPGSYPIRIALALREPCGDARNDIVAAGRLAPRWPATINAARRCGLPIPR